MVWGGARYLSVTEAPHNSESLRVCVEETVLFFQSHGGVVWWVVGLREIEISRRTGFERHWYLLFQQYRCNRPDYPPPPPTVLHPGIFWTIPGYSPEYILGYSLGTPRLYPRVYSWNSESIPHMPRLYPRKFRVGYSLGDRGIFWDIFYMITINFKFNIEKFSRTIGPIKNAPINYLEVPIHFLYIWVTSKSYLLGARL